MGRYTGEKVASDSPSAEDCRVASSDVAKPMDPNGSAMSMGKKPAKIRTDNAIQTKEHAY